MKTRIVFFGTPRFAAEVLEFLREQSISIQAVVTQPDRPQGRSLKLAPSAVKQAAEGLLLLQPEKASDPLFLEVLKALKADLFVVVAYGQILSQKLLDIPPLGCINVHASLLPKYRGAAPIQRCLLDGVNETGVCVQKMVKQLDAGDIIAEAKIAVPVEMTYGKLQQALCDESKILLAKVLKMYENGVPSARPQDPAGVTYAAKIEIEEAEIDWTLPASKLHNKVRAFSPKPGAWCRTADGQRVKILRTQICEGEGRPGQMLDRRAIVACGYGALQLLEVQPEGKKAMSAEEWLRGKQNFINIFTQT